MVGTTAETQTVPNNVYLMNVQSRLYRGRSAEPRTHAPFLTN